MFALREMNMQGQALFEEQMLPGSKAGGLGLAEGRGHFRVSRCMVSLSASDSRGLVHVSENSLKKTPTGEIIWVFLGKAELIKKTASPSGISSQGGVSISSLFKCESVRCKPAPI